MVVMYYTILYPGPSKTRYCIFVWHHNVVIYKTFIQHLHQYDDWHNHIHQSDLTQHGESMSVVLSQH